MKRHEREELEKNLSYYEELFHEMWKIEASIVGELTLELIFKVCIKRILPVFSFLEDMIVSSKGISFDKLRQNVNKLSPHDLKNGFQDLIYELYTCFSILWGETIIENLPVELKKLDRMFAHRDKIKKDF